ncbi:Hpt domain-containing protein [Palleronia sp. LCG004]|uniref:Hpt domain-containing protein n=1 Tax=Palleronia sp. LCG004 TaxID=3079304 RepID=UPI002943B576|nr:Hpt domain-containing protein [Palleronia sp. LCG004]WOI58253.1 Hpt domain-containing protein [Palleronia sp. LCG004]
MRDKILDLVTRHCATLRVEAAEIDAAMADLARDPSGTGSDLVGRVHKLKGSSGSIGFTEISELCRQMEEILRAAQGRPRTEADLTEIRARHAMLRDRIAGIAPEHSTLYKRFA